MGLAQWQTVHTLIEMFQVIKMFNIVERRRFSIWPIYIEWTLLTQLFGLVYFQKQGSWLVYIIQYLH